MKKLILILLCLPFFIFSQEEREYEKTMSVSQFAEELKQAADKGVDYTLENCEITYDPVRDRQYVITNTGDESFEADALIKDIHFPDTSMIDIKNCTFGKKHLGGGIMPSITFQNCRFGDFEFHNTKESMVAFDSIIANTLTILLDTTIGFTVTNSTIGSLNCRNSSYNIEETLVMWYSSDIENNKIEYCYLYNIPSISITENAFTYLWMGGSSASIRIHKNTFLPKLDVYAQIKQTKSNQFDLLNYSGCRIYS